MTRLHYYFNYIVRTTDCTDHSVFLQISLCTNIKFGANDMHFLFSTPTNNN